MPESYYNCKLKYIKRLCLSLSAELGVEMLIELKNGLVSIILSVIEEKLLINKLTFNGQDYLDNQKGIANSYVHLSGGNYRGHFFGGYAKLSEILTYDSHQIIEENGIKKLITIEKNQNIKVKTVYTVEKDLSTLEVFKEVTNVSPVEQVVESATPICLNGIMDRKINFPKETNNVDIEYASPLFFGDRSYSENEPPYLWKAYNSWCSECLFEKIDTRQDGLRQFYKREKSTTLSVTSNCSSTTCRYLPIGILEKEPFGYFMFEIFNDGCWSYSLQQATGTDTIALYIGKNLYENGWYKVLQLGESFCTERVRLCGAESLDKILKEFTLARRKAVKKSGYLPFNYVIYNNFMQNTFDSPTEQVDQKNIEQAKKYGADYFVIDAGWHDDNLEGISPTQKIGEWRENSINYPSGLNKTLNYIRQNGMKPGLWVEVQSVGVYCKNNNLLPDECYFNIHGKRLICNRRYQLNFAIEKTRQFATGIIDSIVGRYSPEYIKIDYNQVQYGTETCQGSLTEGLSLHFKGYLQWFEEIQAKYPQILFESCASGGMNMSPTISEKTTLFSLSDLNNYTYYPYIIANSPFAVLPEQSGIWNIPVRKVVDGKITPLSELKTDDEEVIWNVINSLYMVMHLGSKLEYLTEKQSNLLKEGIAYYKKLSEIKQEAFPIMPNGFTQFGEELVYVAMKHGKKIYLSVYNLSNKDMVAVKDFSDYKISKAKIAYPLSANNEFSIWNGVFQCQLKAGTARAFELV